MPEIYDPCKPGCCKTGIPGICHTKRVCPCHMDTDRNQKILDEWTELKERAS